MMTFILTVGLVILLALGVPVGIALCVSGCLGFIANMGAIRDLWWLEWSI